MDGQRQRAGAGRRRKRRPRSEARAKPEPILIAARRPGAPAPSATPRALIAASAKPNRVRGAGDDALGATPAASRAVEPAPKRSARIVQPKSGLGDEREKLRAKLLSKLLTSEGRGAISRAADELAKAGFEAPAEQQYQLQLLEHFDESRARDAMQALAALLEREPPIKRPVLQQRLRRLEEHAEEQLTREAAATLRRNLRC